MRESKTYRVVCVLRNIAQTYANMRAKISFLLLQRKYKKLPNISKNRVCASSYIKNYEF